MSVTTPIEPVPTRPAHRGAVWPEDGPQDVPQTTGSAVESDPTSDEENA